MAQEIKEGDIVKLKSGGITMTVGGFSSRVGIGKTALCYWSVSNPNEIKQLEIAIGALTNETKAGNDISFS